MDSRVHLSSMTKDFALTNARIFATRLQRILRKVREVSLLADIARKTRELCLPLSLSLSLVTRSKRRADARGALLLYFRAKRSEWRSSADSAFSFVCFEIALGKLRLGANTNLQMLIYLVFRAWFTWLDPRSV